MRTVYLHVGFRIIPDQTACFRRYIYIYVNILYHITCMHNTKIKFKSELILLSRAACHPQFQAFIATNKQAMQGKARQGQATHASKQTKCVFKGSKTCGPSHVDPSIMMSAAHTHTHMFSEHQTETTNAYGMDKKPQA